MLSNYLVGAGITVGAYILLITVFEKESEGWGALATLPIAAGGALVGSYMAAGGEGVAGAGGAMGALYLYMLNKDKMQMAKRTNERATYQQIVDQCNKNPGVGTSAWGACVDTASKAAGIQSMVVH
jgi:hypothetical protein